MPLTIAIQMDPIASITFETDTTLLMALEAQRRGFPLYYYQPKDLFLKDGEVYAGVHPLTVRHEKGNHFTLGEQRVMALREMDVVLLRQDPPYNMQYLTTTYLLERVHPHTLVVNNPTEVRNCPEKLFVCQFPQLMPPTLISQNVEEIRKFWEEYGDIVIKPLYGFAGMDVFQFKKGDKNLGALLELLTRVDPMPVIAQRFLPQVAEGDMRMLFIDGKAVGGLVRVPAPNEIRSNLRLGGRAEKAVFNDHHQEIAALLGPEFKKRGLIVVGIDIIGGYVTEINVTSPTGFPATNRLNNDCLEATFWDAVEKIRTSHK